MFTLVYCVCSVFFFKQKTAYEMRISDWSSDVCSSDLRADLVDHVDRLVRQLAIVDVARRQFHRRLDRVGGVFDVVMLLERAAQPGQDLDRVLARWFVDVDLLEPAQHGAVLLELGRASCSDRVCQYV